MTVLRRLRLEDLEFETILSYITRWAICLSVYLSHSQVYMHVHVCVCVYAHTHAHIL